MSGTTSGKLRIRAVAQRMARGESGVTLVEMMVSLFIFAIVSTMFTTAIVQYLHFHQRGCDTKQVFHGNSHVGAKPRPVCALRGGC